LNAPNSTSQLGIKVTSPNGQTQTIDTNNSNAFKIVFAAGTTASSIGARVRLDSTILVLPGTYQVQLTQDGNSLGSFPFTAVRVTPAIIGTSPANFQQATLGQTASGTTPLPAFVIDGGYYGNSTPPATPEVGSPVLNNNNALLATNITPRFITGNMPSPGGPSPSAGLFPIS